MSRHSAAALRLLADCCRKQAKGASRQGVTDRLNALAADYDDQADRTDRADATEGRRRAPRPVLPEG